MREKNFAPGTRLYEFFIIFENAAMTLGVAPQVQGEIWFKYASTETTPRTDRYCSLVSNIRSRDNNCATLDTSKKEFWSMTRVGFERRNYNC